MTSTSYLHFRAGVDKNSRTQWPSHRSLPTSWSPHRAHLQNTHSKSVPPPPHLQSIPHLLTPPKTSTSSAPTRRKSSKRCTRPFSPASCNPPTPRIRIRIWASTSSSARKSSPGTHRRPSCTKRPRWCSTSSPPGSGTFPPCCSRTRPSTST
jgi:hypothetical protein